MTHPHVLGSNPNDFGAICQRQIFHIIFLQFTDKDNTNERNESLFSNCRVQLNFCKVTSFYQITKVLCRFFPPLNLSCKITTEHSRQKPRSYHAHQAVPRGTRDGELVNKRRATRDHEAGNECPNREPQFGL